MSLFFSKDIIRASNEEIIYKEVFTFDIFPFNNDWFFKNSTFFEDANQIPWQIRCFGKRARQGLLKITNKRVALSLHRLYFIHFVSIPFVTVNFVFCFHRRFFFRDINFIFTLVFSKSSLYQYILHYLFECRWGTRYKRVTQFPIK